MVKQHGCNAMVSLCGGVVTYFFGGWDDLLTLFLFAIVLDYLSGIGASIIEGKGLSSSIGFKGLVVKVAMMLIIVLAQLMDAVLHTDVIMDGAIYFFLSNELISIIENYGRMGLPLPKQVKNVIKILRDKS